MSRGPTLTHRAEYLALLAAGSLFRALPGALEPRSAEALGSFGGTVLRFRRPVVDANLRIAFPEKTDAERARIATASYRHLVREGEYLLSSMLRARDRESVVEQTPFADAPSEEVFEWVRARGDRGESTVLLTGHLGVVEVRVDRISEEPYQSAAVFDKLLQRRPGISRPVNESTMTTFPP